MHGLPFGSQEVSILKYCYLSLSDMKSVIISTISTTCPCLLEDAIRNQNTFSPYKTLSLIGLLRFLSSLAEWLEYDEGFLVRMAVMIMRVGKIRCMA